MFFIVFQTSIPPSNRALSSQYYTKLQDLVGETPGFISEKGYISTTDEGARLLFAQFEDEESAHRWRRHSVHLKIQREARERIFTDYRIRAGPEISFDLLGDGSNVDLEKECSDGNNGLLLILEYDLDDNASSEEIDRIVLSRMSKSAAEAVGTYINASTRIHLIPLQDIASARELVRALGLKIGVRVYCMDVVRDYGNISREQAPFLG